MTSEQCINIIKNRLIALVDSGQLKATYKPSNSTISFYVNDIDVGERPLLTLRLSDHNPKYWSYVQQGLTPPYEGDGVNVSIEFYRPKKVNGRKQRNRVDTRVKVPPMVNGVVPFVVNSYDYTPEKLGETDIDLIYDAILSWINGGYGAKYIDPFANTPKKAKVQSKNANITWNIAHNISVDKDGNYVSANGWGADFVSESMRNKKLNCNRNMNKKLIRLTESDLHRIVRESVNKVLNEIGDTNRGQYHLGRAAMRRFNMGDYDKAGEIGRYAEKKRVNDPDYDLESSNSTGMRHQNIYMNGGDPQKYYRDVIQRTDDRLR